MNAITSRLWNKTWTLKLVHFLLVLVAYFFLVSIFLISWFLIYFIYLFVYLSISLFILCLIYLFSFILSFFLISYFFLSCFFSFLFFSFSFLSCFVDNRHRNRCIRCIYICPQWNLIQYFHWSVDKACVY